MQTFLSNLRCFGTKSPDAQTQESLVSAGEDHCVVHVTVNGSHLQLLMLAYTADSPAEKAPVAAVTAVVPAERQPREIVNRQEAVARVQERRNAGRKQRKASDDIDPMDPVSFMFSYPSLYIVPHYI